MYSMLLYTFQAHLPSLRSLVTAAAFDEKRKEVRRMFIKIFVMVDISLIFKQHAFLRLLLSSREKCIKIELCQVSAALSPLMSI